MAQVESIVGLSEAEIRGLVEAFKSFDLDGTGQIEPHELNRVLLRCDIKRSPKEIADMIKEVDITNDGEINFVEFCTMVKMRDQPVENLELEAIFDKFEGRQSMLKNGLVSRADLSLAFQTLNINVDDSEIDQIFNSVGLIGNAGMNKTQFCKLFRMGEGLQISSPEKRTRPQQNPGNSVEVASNLE